MKRLLRRSNSVIKTGNSKTGFLEGKKHKDSTLTRLDSRPAKDTDEELNDVVRSLGYNVLRPLGTGSFGRIVLVHELSNSENLFALKANLKSTSELNAEEAVEAEKQSKELEYFVEKLPVGLVKRHLLLSTLPKLKKVIEAASPPKTDLRLFDGNIVRRAFAESRLLSMMDSPFIVKLHRNHEKAGRIFMLLEYLAGGTLKFHLDQSKGRRFDVERARYYAAELLLAIEHMQLPSVDVSHRDLKPENIMFDAHGHLVVSDFGLATRLGGEVKTFCGTAEYLAPEVLIQKSWSKDTLDIWSWAIIFL